MFTPEFLSQAWKVLCLFVIPFGGGVPSGVVLANDYKFSWQLILFLYFISDLILACVFEPLLIWFVKASSKSEKMTLFRQKLAANFSRLFPKGFTPKPLSLVLVAFVVDPMTGRSVSYAAGHGFFSGWAMAILGDMASFTIWMASTLWLDHFLGNGTLAALIVTVVLLGVPPLFRRLRKALKF